MTTNPSQGTSTLLLRRLGWAGVEIRLGDTRLLIDPLQNVAHMEPVLGPPKRALPAVELTEGTHVLLTHTHPDHYDRALLSRLPVSGTIGCHAAVVSELAADGTTAIPQELGDPRRIGPLTVTPVTSLDWRGTDSVQVGWVVEGAGARIIHCGDTMWHGNWWQIARDHGPFDVAFLPVNGVIARFEGYDVNVPVTMTPEQAVEAASALGAGAVCAIHYELFDNPPIYTEQLDIVRRFRQAADSRGIIAHVVADGEPVPLPAKTGERSS
jgi:L-ascorbate metabolism protein UlaG (beta-lactamase superfamily)